jgi:hypothetical protein
MSKSNEEHGALVLTVSSSKEDMAKAMKPVRDSIKQLRRDLYVSPERRQRPFTV